jgi:hypothetical protein
VSPQFHVIYDDLFTTVPNAETGGIFDLENFQSQSWARLLSGGSELYIEEEFDERGNRIPPPELHDDWLTPGERRVRDEARRTRLLRHAGSGTRLAPEGDGGDDVEAIPVPVPMLMEPQQVPVPVEETHDDDFPPDDDHFDEVDDNGTGGTTTITQDQPEVADDANQDETDPNEVITRAGRRPKRNRKFFGEPWANYQCGKDPKQKI